MIEKGGLACTEKAGEYSDGKPFHGNSFAGGCEIRCSSSVAGY
jgi:hypothetical protein